MTSLDELLICPTLLTGYAPSTQKLYAKSSILLLIGIVPHPNACTSSINLTENPFVCVDQEGLVPESN